MAMKENPMTQRILDLTLEIIYLLTGEDHIVVKIPGGSIVDNSSRQVYDGYCRTQSSSMERPPPSPIHGRKNEQKILELTHRILRLLTGEVPIRCEDVTVHLSMEEWEYVEGHKELYEDAMVEDHQPVITADRFHSPVSPPDLATENGTKKGGKYLVINNSGQYEAATNPSRTFLSSEQVNLEDTDVYPTSERSQTDIKEEPASCEGENLFSGAHTGDKPFKCNECGKCLSTKYYLIKHYRIHSEKMFKCGECGKNFFSHDLLVLHERIHTGEKPFKCTDCGKCFIQASHLASHKVTHTGEKPFKCDECGASFTRSSSLASHKWIHTGVKPFKCNVCGKRFTRSSYLATHKMTHTGETRFICGDCGKGFTRRQHFIQHQKIHNR